MTDTTCLFCETIVTANLGNRLCECDEPAPHHHCCCYNARAGDDVDPHDDAEEYDD